MTPEPKLKLLLKPCGDCWLHVDAPSGVKASLNLGQRGSMTDQPGKYEHTCNTK